MKESGVAEQRQQPESCETPDPLSNGKKPKKNHLAKSWMWWIRLTRPLYYCVMAYCQYETEHQEYSRAVTLELPYTTAGIKKSIDPAKFQKLVNTKDETGKNIFGAGGNPKNLKKAILSGKGNKDKAVNGLEGFGMIDSGSVQYMSEYTPWPNCSEQKYTMMKHQRYGRALVNWWTHNHEQYCCGQVLMQALLAMLKDVGNIFKENKGSGRFWWKEKWRSGKRKPVPSGQSTFYTGNNKKNKRSKKRKYSLEVVINPAIHHQNQQTEV